MSFAKLINFEENGMAAHLTLTLWRFHLWRDCI